MAIIEYFGRHWEIYNFLEFLHKTGGGRAIYILMNSSQICGFTLKKPGVYIRVGANI